MAHDRMSRLAQRGRSPYTSEVRAAASPAVGTEFSIIVDSGQTWKLLAVRARLVTSAVVANRAPALVIDNQSATAMELPVGSVLAATLTTDISWVADYGAFPTAVVGNRIIAPMPDIVLQPGWRIRSNTVAIDAGDQYSAVTIYIDRLDSPPMTLNMEYGVPVEDLMALIEQKVTEAQ